MKRLIAVGAAAALLAGGANAIAAGDAERKVAPQSGSAQTSPIDERMAQLRKASALAQSAKVKCQTLRCVNGSLTKLARAAIAFDTAFGCMQKVGLTQYSNYVITDGQGNFFQTTGLDYTEPGATPSNTFLTFVC
jgi:hypothetical protein